MSFFFILFTSLILSTSALAVPSNSSDIQIRVLPASPSNSYAPSVVSCPQSRPKIRTATKLSTEEADWLQLRRKEITDPLVEFLDRSSIPNFDAQRFRSQNGNDSLDLPRIALAFSGGGYRALMNGAGFISAADNRSQDLPKTGGIQGLLQSATYIAGLSGGNWLVGSIYSNNFSTVQEIQSKGWKFDRSIFKGPKEKGISLLNTADYWTEIATQVAAKAEGWDTSLTDYWGRALSYQLVEDEEGGPAYTFSSIARSDHFMKASTPFPIVVADGRAPGEKVGFAPLRYIGSNFSAGAVPKDGRCVEGFDQIGFVMGTSSTLFNQFLLQNLSSVTGDLPSFLNETLYKVLDALDESENDVAQYAPNPFLDWQPSTNPGAKSSQLTLVDGGEDLQNLPLHPLIQPIRAVDVIFAIDSSADTAYNWPNGTALRATYERSLSSIGNGTLFPSIPDAETFVNLGLNKRPTFFGCDASNFTISKGQTVPPLVVYIPNAPYVAASNVSTFDPKYPTEQRDAIIMNGFEAATQGNGTLDSEWRACMGCAVLSRTLHRAGEPLPDACNKCFSRYCWNGTLNQQHVQDYEPTFIIGNVMPANSAEKLSTVRTVVISLTSAVITSLVVALV
jgi:lysophospholipase